MTRPREAMVYPIADESVTGRFDRYAVAINKSGEVRMVHTEGVAYAVRDDKPWTWNDFDPSCPKFTPMELIALASECEPVNLADWVRVFGARLESNFAQVYEWVVRS